MTFNLKLIFGGPCVYVPAADQDALHVLVVDASQPEPGSEQRIHEPALVFDLSHLRSAENTRVIRFDGSDGRPRGAVFLGREELTVGGIETQQSLTFFDDGGQLPNPAFNDRFGFNRMPRLEDAAPGSGRIQPAAIDASEPPPAVAVRARLTQGDVYTARMSLLNSIAFTHWVFAPPSNPIAANPRPLGLDVGVDLVIEQLATLTLTHFTTQARRVLTFAALPNQTEINIHLANREPASIFHDFPEVSPPPKRDPDFAYNYRVSVDAPGSDAPIPQVIGGGATRGGTTCGGSVGESGGD